MSPKTPTTLPANGMLDREVEQPSARLWRG
jgi:hypothetical protein